MKENLLIYGTLHLPKVQLKIIGRVIEPLPDVLKGYKKQIVVINETEYFTLLPMSGQRPSEL